MKTTVTAFLLFAVLVGGSIWFYTATEHACIGFEQNSNAGYHAALGGDWSAAEKSFQKLQTDWEEQKKLLAVFTHHNLLEDVQRALARVTVTVQARDTENLQLEFATLKEVLSALRYSDTARLENIF